MTSLTTKPTPHRGASSSARRKIIAQQSIQHIKRQMNGSNGLYKDSTPRGRNGENLGHANTAMIPQIGSSGLVTQSRIKSSRQSHKPQNAGGSDRQQRAITPKSQQKMYQSININKPSAENRGTSSKIQANYT